MQIVLFPATGFEGVYGVCLAYIEGYRMKESLPLSHVP